MFIFQLLRLTFYSFKLCTLSLYSYIFVITYRIIFLNDLFWLPFHYVESEF